VTDEDPTTVDRRLPADYHLHTGFSDGAGVVGDVIDRAARRGLPEIGFSDHLIPREIDDGYGVPYERLDDYVDTIRAAAARRPGLRVLAAMEVDYVPGFVDESRAIVARLGLDYVIGSVHLIDGQPFDLEENVRIYSEQDAEDVQSRYFGLVREAVETGMIDVVGHFDLIRKLGVLPPPGGRALAAADEALQAAAAGGVAVEINTAGWRHPTGEQYPRVDLLARARELGVPLTFGSDAHRPEHVGARFEDAVRVARAAGYTHWLRLSDRTEVSLP
jgi:histidinol-phosphatase (PHP family)